MFRTEYINYTEQKCQLLECEIFAELYQIGIQMYQIGTQIMGNQKYRKSHKDAIVKIINEVNF